MHRKVHIKSLKAGKIDDYFVLKGRVVNEEGDSIFLFEREQWIQLIESGLFDENPDGIKSRIYLDFDKLRNDYIVHHFDIEHDEGNSVTLWRGDDPDFSQ